MHGVQLIDKTCNQIFDFADGDVSFTLYIQVLHHSV